MSNQIVISSGAKVRNLSGVLTGTSGVVNSLGINVPDGIPQLDSNGKILVTQLPNSVMEYKGTWNVSTNTPTLANGTGNQGDVYLVEGAASGGTSFDFGAGPITFYNGDQVVYSGSIWQRASGSTGTVTSVAVTESGDALTITGSPITNSGTINIGFAGTTDQYVNGAGGLTTFPSLTGYVPYTGATANVDLGYYGLEADYLNVNVPSTHTPTVGDIVWNSVDGTFDMGLLNGVTLQAGQELHFYGKASGAIGNGKAVMFAGVEGDHLLMAEADAATINANPQYFIGVATQDFANNDFGYVTVLGKVRGLDTTAYTLGSVLYYDSTSATDGLLTATMPNAPNAKIEVAAVVRVHATQGVLMVRPHIMPKLSLLQDVNVSSVANGNILAWDTNKWQNNTIAGVLGYTPANAATYVPYNGATSSLNMNNQSLYNAAFLGSNSSVQAGSVSYAGKFQYKNGTSGSFSPLDGYTTLEGTSTYFSYAPNTTDRAIFYYSSGLKGYTLPSASGTLALTSDLSGYLPLSGGTLTGKLTINTGGVDNQLQLNGTAPSLRLTNAVTGATINGFIAMAGTAGDYILTSAVGDMCIGNQNSGKIIFGFGSGTATSKMSLDASGNGVFSGTISATGGTLTGALSGTSATFSGNVSVGNSNPNAILSSTATSNGVGIELRARASDDTYSQINFTNNAGTNVNVLMGAERSGTNGGNMYFYTKPDGSGIQERMRITSGGTVCIGTTSALPGSSNLLSVLGTSAGPTFANPDSNQQTLLLWNKGTSGNNLFTEFATESSVTTRGSISYNRAVGVVAYNTTSDYRLKSEISDFNALNIINNLKPKEFKIGNAENKSIGFIAHELQEYLPQAVSGTKDAIDEKGNPIYQCVDYSQLTALLTKSIQEQQAQIEELKQLILNK